MSLPGLVIFDCDGVVVDSVMAHCEILAQNLARYGLEMTPLQCRDEFGSGKMAAIGEHARRLGAALPGDWLDEIYAEIFARLADGVPLIDGVEEVLGHLEERKVPFCIASNGSVDKMALMLEPSGVLERFSGAMFSAHTIGAWKPDPDLFIHAAGTMNVHPQDCVVIEDSPTGVQAAVSANMACYAYTPGAPQAAFQEYRATVFNHMLELPELFGLE